jgi:hypothetical protein
MWGSLYKARKLGEDFYLVGIFCFTGEISPKSQIKLQNFKNEMILKGFNPQKWAPKKVQTTRFL